MSAKDATHPEPVWRDRADFIIGVRLSEDDATEQLWAKRLKSNLFEICCIPFFAYDIALGDVVETNVDHDVTRVVQRSERVVFRVWFGDSFHPRQDLANELVGMGALLEWSSANLLAVDVSEPSRAQAVADFLAQREDEGKLTYENGRSS
jgi:hypothetical protein